MNSRILTSNKNMNFMRPISIIESFIQFFLQISGISMPIINFFSCSNKKILKLIIKKKWMIKKLQKSQFKKMNNEEDEFQDYVGTDELNKQDEELNIDQKLYIQQAEDKNNKIYVPLYDQNEIIGTIEEEEAVNRQQNDDKLETIQYDRETEQIINESRQQEMLQLQQAELIKVEIVNKENEIIQMKEVEYLFKDQDYIEEIEEIKQSQEPQYQNEGVYSVKNEQSDETGKIQFEPVLQQQIEDNNLCLDVQLKDEKRKDNEQIQEDEEEFGDFEEQTTMQSNLKTVVNIPQISEQQPPNQTCTTQVSLSGNETNLSAVQKRQTEIEHQEENPQKEETSTYNQPQAITQIQPHQQLPVSQQLSKPPTLEDQLAVFLKNLPNYSSIIQKSFIDANHND